MQLSLSFFPSLQDMEAALLAQDTRYDGAFFVAGWAVARANGQNPVNILIPCHRVLGKKGQLTGYNGGLWRKRLLLWLEQAGAIPRYAG